jgi:hypothetical protein
MDITWKFEQLYILLMICNFALWSLHTSITQTPASSLPLWTCIMTNPFDLYFDLSSIKGQSYKSSIIYTAVQIFMLCPWRLHKNYSPFSKKLLASWQVAFHSPSFGRIGGQSTPLKISNFLDHLVIRTWISNVIYRGLFVFNDFI